MKQLNEHHTFTGMQQDLDIALHPAQFLYHAKNVRLTPRNGDTLFAISNEKGTETIVNATIPGFYLGHCLLDKYLVVFTHALNSSTPDYISRMDLDANSPLFTQLYNGNLGFSLEYPIEAIGSYENESIQKVYWTDGLNQPRVINIVGSTTGYNDDSFDFVRTLKLNETVVVEKLLGASGSFAPGVIQYAFTYYTKYGQESNIFYTTPLMYISHRDRGASPEDKVANAFKISITDVDTEHSFDYVRIYSIQRTSLNGVPIVKRVTDLKISSSLVFTDTGSEGDSIDPAELLYKGGESISAKTLEQKDNTLFLGNIGTIRPSIDTELKNSIVANTTITSSTRAFKATEVSEGAYYYANQLTSFEAKLVNSSWQISNKTVPCGGFKKGDYYRLGVQFQYKTGKWSDPIRLKDYQITNFPEQISGNDDIIKVPAVKARIGAIDADKLVKAGYCRARAVVVFPDMQDRVVLCQGVVCPTVEKGIDVDMGNDAPIQSSWFWRPLKPDALNPIPNDFSIPPKPVGVATPDSENIYYKYNGISDSPNYLRATEIQGHYDDSSKFSIYDSIFTFHFPDIEFDDRFASLDYTGTSYQEVGYVLYEKTLSDINIQLETPPISSSSNGFIHKSFTCSKSYGIMAGLFYEDYIVNDSTDTVGAFDKETSSVKWMVYPWQRSGSLNNDYNRPTNQGVRSGVLKKKVISNLRYATTSYGANYYEGYIPASGNFGNNVPQIFNQNYIDILKFNSKVYFGNVDTVLSPDKEDGLYFAFGGSGLTDQTTVDEQTLFSCDAWYKTMKVGGDSEAEPPIKAEGVIENWTTEGSVNKWLPAYDPQTKDVNLMTSKESVRMKYKSSPHLVLPVSITGPLLDRIDNTTRQQIIEILRNGDTSGSYWRNSMFGGNTSYDHPISSALQSNVWVPCGEPVSLGNGSTYVDFYYSYGDTYYQRWDCLKTYPFTKEDINQIVEIGSFMLETHVNIDGRYDRNRGQLDNTNMSPENFNLLNPVYSQVDNFFSYRILDEQYYNIDRFPNEITWTKEKAAGAEIDAWTNITLGSTYDMDGSKGEVISLNLWRDNIYCFQNKGVSNILFNSRVQIPTSDGVPIEISNSYKVDGYRYLSDGVGCKDARLIKETPAGVYFMDSISSHLYYIGDGLQDVSATHNMTSWFNQNGSSVKKLLYDDVNKDIYLVRDDDSMCYSELLGQFTGFYDYDDIKLIESWDKKTFTMRAEHLYRMFNGDYNYFFNAYKPWEFTFVSNGADQSMQDFDKIFTNVDYRMDIQDSNGYAHDATLDYLRVWNEYQDTRLVELGNKNGAVRYTTYPQNYVGSNVQKKFRIWRLQIPRTKKEKTVEGVTEWVNTNDRIRNTWCKVNLGRRTLDASKAILHDLNVQYYV